MKAVKLLSKWGFENTDLMRFEIKCAVENVRSQRVAEKTGAIREGIRKSCLEIHGKKHDAVVSTVERNKIDFTDTKLRNQPNSLERLRRAVGENKYL